MSFGCRKRTGRPCAPGRGRPSPRMRIPASRARAAAAAGVDAIFLECHPTPEMAPSDGSNMLPLDGVADVLRSVAQIAAASR